MSSARNSHTHHLHNFAVMLCLLLFLAFGGWGGRTNDFGGGKAPQCDAGGDRVVECTGAMTDVQLDGTGSTNPTSGQLTYFWESCNDPRVTLLNPESSTPILQVDMSTSCAVTCRVTLVVTNDHGASICMADVTVQDTTAPEITCPADTTVRTGDSIDPQFTGRATATDACVASPLVTWSDQVVENVIVRTWTADDGCQTSTCDQRITVMVVEPETPHIDILPGECPNDIVVGGRPGDFSGTEPGVGVSMIGNAFNVTQVDLTSIRLRRTGGTFAGDVALTPIEVNFMDLATPFIGELCGCHTLTGDETDDLNLFFSRQQIIDAFELELEPAGTLVVFEISGIMLDETPFSGVDCIRVVQR